MISTGFKGERGSKWASQHFTHTHKHTHTCTYTNTHAHTPAPFSDYRPGVLEKEALPGKGSHMIGWFSLREHELNPELSGHVTDAAKVPHT